MIAIIIAVVFLFIVFVLVPKFKSNPGIKKVTGAAKNIGPQMQLTVNKTIHPDTEEFIEFMTIDQQLESGKLIDIGLSWKTTTGFDIVKKLIFKRTVDGEEVQENIEYTGDGIQNHSSGEILFEGDIIKKSPVGENVIKVFYVTKDEKEVKLTELTVDVKKEDLEMTKDLLKPKQVIFKPKSNNTNFGAKVQKENIYYAVLFNAGKKIGIDEDEFDGWEDKTESMTAFHRLKVGNEAGEEIISFLNGNDKLLTVDGVSEFIFRKFDDKNHMLLKDIEGVMHAVTIPEEKHTDEGTFFFNKTLSLIPLDNLKMKEYNFAFVQLVENEKKQKVSFIKDYFAKATENTEEPQEQEEPQENTENA